MRILVVSPHPPGFPGGGSPGRLHFLIRELAKFHTVDVIAGKCWGGEIDIDRLESYCARVAVIHPVQPKPAGSTWIRRLRRWWRWWFGFASDVRDVMRMADQTKITALEWAQSHPPDLIYVHHSMAAPLVQGLLPQVPRIVDLHNIMHLYYLRSIRIAPSVREKLTAFREFIKMKLTENSLFLSGAAFSVCSSQEREIIRGVNPRALMRVVPNGVDCEHFFAEPSGAAQDLLFLGTLSYLPNNDAVIYFISSILPIIQRFQPTARLNIVGTDPPPQLLALHNEKDICLIGQVPDVRPYSLASAIHVVPLRLGSGTRLKILEALAMGRAVVSTSIGAEGLDLVDGQHILIADTPEEFASKTLKLMEDDELRRRLAIQGQRQVRELYDWRVAGESLRQLCRQAILTPDPNRSANRHPWAQKLH